MDRPSKGGPAENDSHRLDRAGFLGKSAKNRLPVQPFP